jgi:hypothetical protein
MTDSGAGRSMGQSIDYGASLHHSCPRALTLWQSSASIDTALVAIVIVAATIGSSSSGGDCRCLYNVIHPRTVVPIDGYVALPFL